MSNVKNDIELDSCQAPCCSPLFGSSSRHLYPICPQCESNDEVAGIYYASVGPLGKVNSDGIYELGELGKRIEVKKTVIMAGETRTWLADPRPMWHCRRCKSNFNN